MTKPALLLALTLLLPACRKPEERFAKLAEEFVFTTLAFSPISATAAGLHEYQGRKLDELLDDYNPATLERQRRYYASFQARLERPADRGALPPEHRADFDIIRNQAALALLELDEIQAYLHNPTIYVEAIGNALYSPYVLNYAPRQQRAAHLIARLRKIPLFLDQAKINLLSSPEIWTRVAADENAGNIALIDKTLRQWVQGGQGEAFEAAAAPALSALHNFQLFLQKNLASRKNWNWRLGRDRYTRKFRYALASGSDPESTLGAASAELAAVRARMLDLAMKVAGHPAKPPAPGDAKAGNALITAALDRIAARHSTRESYLDDARADLAEARRFVQEKAFLTLPARDNLRVIETPEFMRGSFAVGGFNPAPALEPRLGAFYWVTPIPADWPSARVESKLREYNFYKLKLLTLHEAIPGHYLQAEYANDVQPDTRRLLRSVYASGPYVEGWAQYATETMLAEGFLGGAPELRLTFEKERLRVLANAILDIRLHMLDMTDQEALDLMRLETFQEEEEAQAKLQRAKLSSCQLPTYYVGWQGWRDTRDICRSRAGSAFRLAAFHAQALRQGAVPLPALEILLRGR